MLIGRHIGRVTGLIALILVMIGCAETSVSPTGSGANSSDTFRIGMSQANNAEPWRTAMNDQIRSAAEQYPEIELVFADAAQNNAKQVADIEQFLTEGIDLLIVSPNEATPLTDVVSRVYDEGIPVIVLDRKVRGEKYTMWIGADNQLIGKQAGSYVAQWCQEQDLRPCNAVELRGLEGSTPAMERGDGFREGIATNPDVQLVASQNADWLFEKAPALTEAMLQVNPDVQVIYAHNDPMAEGAISALQNLELDPDTVLVVGIDALPNPEGGIRSVMEQRIDVTYVYPTGGAEAIEWAMRILTEGTSPPKEVVLDTEQVTIENAATVLEKYGGQMP